jgi:Na+/proline symporter
MPFTLPQMNFELTGILIYIAMQSVVGFWLARRIASESDYFLAGRSLGPVLATFSIFATWFGAESVIGSAGAIYKSGLSGGRADPFGYTICLWIMGAFFAVRLWNKKLFTLGDLFKTRYSVSIERLAIALLIPGSLFWSAAQIRAFGQVLSASSEINVELATSVAAGLVVLYTMAGGFLADVVTDFIQGVCLIIGLLILFGLLVFKGGGFEHLWASVNPDRLSFIPTEGGSLWSQLEAWTIPIAGSLVAQELISRILATRTPQIARNSVFMGGAIYLFVGLIPVFIGLTGHSFVGNLEEHEQIIPHLARTHLHGFLYIVFAGALISAILSTVNSTLLAISSLLSHNIVVPLLKNPTEKKKVLMARFFVVIAGIISYIIAFYAEGIYELVESASSFGSSGIVIIMIFGLFGNFGGSWSAAAALIVGVVSYMIADHGEFSTPYILSLACAFIAYVAAHPIIVQLNLGSSDSEKRERTKAVN